MEVVMRALGKSRLWEKARGRRGVGRWTFYYGMFVYRVEWDSQQQEGDEKEDQEEEDQGPVL